MSMELSKVDRKWAVLGILSFSLVGASLSGCAAAGGEVNSEDGPVAGGSSSSSGGSGAMNPSSTGGKVTTEVPGSGGSDNGLAQTLPFAVDDFYVPSGFMGDVDSIALTPSEEDPDPSCGGDRSSASAQGDCHKVSYQNEPTMNNWGGVYWQYPTENWGTKPGLVVASGAKKVRFFAKGLVGGEVVKFVAGGLLDPSKPYQDTIQDAFVETVLTTDWSQYEIDLSGQEYTQVLGGFGWTADGEGNPPGSKIEFLVDDIVWE